MDCRFSFRHVIDLLRMPRLKWSNIIPGAESSNYPLLRGPVIKAANTRSYMGFAAHLARVCDSGDAFTTRRRELCELAAEMNDVWDGEGMFLSAASSERIVDLMYNLLIRYSWLSRQAHLQGLLLWNIVPKFHFAHHIAAQSALINPFCTRTYLEEGFVGQVAKMYRAYLRGPHAAVVHLVALLCARF